MAPAQQERKGPLLFEQYVGPDQRPAAEKPVEEVKQTAQPQAEGQKGDDVVGVLLV